MQTNKEFASLVKPHMDLLFYSGLKMTKNHEDTEDLVQETLYKAYYCINQFQVNTNFRAWIYRIMVNTYITGYRKTIRKPAQVSYQEIEDYVLYKQLESSLSANTMKPYQRNSEADHFFDDDVTKALKDLPKHFKDIVTLCDIDNFTYRDIAEFLNLPLGTVMSRLFRGRKLLQKELLEYARKRGIIKDEIKH